MSHWEDLGLKCLLDFWIIWISISALSIGIVDCRQLVWYKCSDIKKFKVSNIPLLIIRIKPPHSITSLLPAWLCLIPTLMLRTRPISARCVSCVWLGVWIALILRGMIPALYLLYTQYICLTVASLLQLREEDEGWLLSVILLWYWLLLLPPSHSPMVRCHVTGAWGWGNRVKIPLRCNWRGLKKE